MIELIIIDQSINSNNCYKQMFIILYYYSCFIIIDDVSTAGNTSVLIID